MSDNKQLNFEIVTPERLLIKGNAHMVVVPGDEGEFGVLKDHAPFMSTIKTGVLKVWESEKSTPEQIFVDGGFAHVSPNGLEVLAEYAVKISEVKKAELEAEIKSTHINLDAHDKGSDEYEILKKKYDRLEALRSYLSEAA